MKKTLCLLFLLVSLISSAQNDPLMFHEVIPVDGKNKTEIFGGLRQWVATYYVNSKAVTQLEDAATGTIIIKAEFPFKKGGMYSAYQGWISYMLKLQVKDGRYRVEMSNFVHSNEPGNASDCALGLLTTAEKSGKGGMNKWGHNKIWPQLKEKAENEFNEIASSLKAINSFNAIEEEDW